jgi:hypothetical protein
MTLQQQQHQLQQHSPLQQQQLLQQQVSSNMFSGTQHYGQPFLSNTVPGLYSSAYGLQHNLLDWQQNQMIQPALAGLQVTPWNFSNILQSTLTPALASSLYNGQSNSAPSSVLQPFFASQQNLAALVRQQWNW